MASARTVARVESTTWVLIFGGFFAIILGIITGNVHLFAGWSLGVIGGIAVVAGIVLIWIRSRMEESPAAGAQSPSHPLGKP